MAAPAPAPYRGNAVHNNIVNEIIEKCKYGLYEIAAAAIKLYNMNNDNKGNECYIHGGLAYEFCIDKNVLLSPPYNTMERSADVDVLFININDQNKLNEKLRSIEQIASLQNIKTFCTFAQIYNSVLLDAYKANPDMNAHLVNYVLTKDDFNDMFFNPEKFIKFTVKRRTNALGIVISRVCISIQNSRGKIITMDLIETCVKKHTPTDTPVAAESFVPVVSAQYVAADINKLLAPLSTYTKKDKARARIAILNEQGVEEGKPLLFPHVNPQPLTFQFNTTNSEISYNTAEARRLITNIIAQHTAILNSPDKAIEKKAVIRYTKSSTATNIALLCKYLFRNDPNPVIFNTISNMSSAFRAVANTVIDESKRNVSFYSMRLTKCSLANKTHLINELSVGESFRTMTFLSSGHKIFSSQIRYQGLSENCIMLFKWKLSDITAGNIMFIQNLSKFKYECEVLINKNVKLFLIDKKYVNITATRENMQKIMLVFSTSATDNKEEKDAVLVSELTNINNNSDYPDDPDDPVDLVDLDYSDDRDKQADIDEPRDERRDNFTGAYQGGDLPSFHHTRIIGDEYKIVPEDENFSYYDEEKNDNVSANNLALFAKCLPVQRPYRKINPPTLAAILLDNIAYSLNDPAVVSIVTGEQMVNDSRQEVVDENDTEELMAEDIYDFEFIDDVERKLKFIIDDKQDEQFTSSSDSSASVSIQLIIFIAILIILVIYLLIQGMLESTTCPTNNLPYN